ncbi:Cytochrome c-552 precursor [Posidoniimonas polymericola]|uniref:nitrite reductase (cytochrome; ammonia-forming) n=1 Tax=Posidoniimonas polymericola TaxID=2528002 RepID=A0A5C5ZF77_9BACT|nr:ammonia-forming cytochrome c nitrite reductase subunit c552 [Posidoniimonas polymericola]TWT85982.1 Cytochrome c-552 precursor [Posidoniimonas polymericola]
MRHSGKTSFWLLLLVAVISGGACFAIASLLLDVQQHKIEARTPIVRVAEVTDDTTDPAIWGQNWPLQYDDYLKTADMTQTTYGGSEAVPNVPTDEDPRDVVSKSKLETIPQLKRMWAGYAFAKDFREERGHAYMLTDQMYTERQKVGQPGTCINCHASTYVAMKELGDGDIMVGFEKLNMMPYMEAKEHLSHAVACIDCHDPDTMALRVTRPAFIEGIAAAKASEGVDDYDVNTQATRHEMRTYVCAQCHVEYYFKGEKKRLTYPWDKGLTIDDAYAYYEEAGFKDWTHAETGAPMLKAQHPEFELWSQGIHAKSGVTCADCHMPYKRVGGTKISDHHVRSPLLNVNRACGTCHKQDDAELIARAENIQTTHRHLVESALNALVDLIDDIKVAKEAGATDEQLAEALQWQRKASFYVDYVEAENSSGFHAGQYAARILGDSINYSRKGQNALRGLQLAAADDTAEPADEQAAEAQTGG